MTQIVSKLPQKPYKRTYALVEHKAELKLAVRIDEEWILDQTCTDINRLLRAGNITKQDVVTWLNMDYLKKVH